jgi:hypothetical protein
MAHCNFLAHVDIAVKKGRLFCPACGRFSDMKINPYAFEKHFPLEIETGKISFWEFERMENQERINLLVETKLIDVIE